MFAILSIILFFAVSAAVEKLFREQINPRLDARGW